MLQLLAEVAIYEVPRAFGWALLKVVTLGRYRRRDPEEWFTEGTVGFASLAGLTWLSVHWL